MNPDDTFNFNFTSFSLPLVEYTQAEKKAQDKRARQAEAARIRERANRAKAVRTAYLAFDVIGYSSFHDEALNQAMRKLQGAFCQIIGAYEMTK